MQLKETREDVQRTSEEVFRDREYQVPVDIALFPCCCCRYLFVLYAPPCTFESSKPTATQPSLTSNQHNTQVDAVIVRTMKSRKRLTHPQLMGEVLGPSPLFPLHIAPQHTTTLHHVNNTKTTHKQQR